MSEIPEWREAQSIALMDLKIIIGNEDDLDVNRFDFGYRNRLKIEGSTIDKIAMALGIDTRCWYETRYVSGKPDKKSAMNLASSEFNVSESFSFYPGSCNLEKIRVKDFHGYLEIELDLARIDNERGEMSRWVEPLTYSGRYSVCWPFWSHDP